jgi:hypothetical protein
MIREIFDEVEKVLDNYFQRSYHVSCYITDETWTLDMSSVSFTVKFHSDQGYGSDWEEYWSIDSEGIHTEEDTYKDLEGFKSYWG